MSLTREREVPIFSEYDISVFVYVVEEFNNTYLSIDLSPHTCIYIIYYLSFYLYFFHL